MTTTTRTHDHTQERYALTGFMTNACNCNQLEQEQDNNYECYGYCWDEQLEDWTNCMQDWVDDNPTNEWLVTDYPTWTGGITGVTVARTVEELLYAITPRSEYNMSWTLSTTTDATTQATTRMLECMLSHHDAPTGGRMTVQYAPVCD